MNVDFGDLLIKTERVAAIWQASDRTVIVYDDNNKYYTSRPYRSVIATIKKINAGYLAGIVSAPEYDDQQ